MDALLGAREIYNVIKLGPRYRGKNSDDAWCI